MFFSAHTRGSALVVVALLKILLEMATERTYIMIKPDGVHRGLVGEIVGRFERKGFKLVALKFLQVGRLCA